MLKHAIWMVLAVRLAAAQPTSSEADRLFDEGIALFEAGKFAEACRKFEQSIAKDPHAIGTLMNLGRCNERRGKVATALKRFEEAHDRASRANAAAMREAAKERIAALTPQVPVVALRRTAAARPGEKLLIDDEVVANDVERLRLDPGDHTLVLAAPGRLSYQTTFVAVARETITVELPELAAPARGTTVRIRPSSRRLAGKIGTFAGAGIAVVGGGVALYAKRDYDKQFEDPDGSGPRVASCSPPPSNECSEAGQTRIDRDRNLGTTATVIGVVGLAVAATGVVLWLTAPTERTTVVPTATASGFQIDLVGRF